MKLTDKLEFDGKTVECKRYIQALVPFWSEFFCYPCEIFATLLLMGGAIPFFDV